MRVFEYRRAYRCIGAGSHDESSCVREFGGSIDDLYGESILHARRPAGATIIRINIGSARGARAPEEKLVAGDGDDGLYGDDCGGGAVER